MAKDGKTRSGGGGWNVSTLKDIEEVTRLLDERERITHLWDQLENHIHSAPVIDVRAVHRDLPIGAEFNTRLQVPRHVIVAMKDACERRRHEITGILVRNYGIKDA